MYQLQNNDLQLQKKAILNSYSWRFLSPVRYCFTILKSIIGFLAISLKRISFVNKKLSSTSIQNPNYPEPIKAPKQIMQEPDHMSVSANKIFIDLSELIEKSRSEKSTK